MSRRVWKSPAGSADDVELRNGDQLLIPKRNQEVTILGEVQSPTSHVWQSGLTRDDYIAKSGGATQKADRKRIYVVRVNGDVFSGERTGWFRRSQNVEIHPGDTIVVPLDTERVRALPLVAGRHDDYLQSSCGVAGGQKRIDASSSIVIGDRYRSIFRDQNSRWQLNSGETIVREQADEVDLVAIWKLAWGFKYLILTIALLCAVLAGIYAFSLNPIFRAEIVVLPVRSGGMGGGGGLSGQLGGLASIASLAGVNLDSGGGAEREAKAVLESRKMDEEFIKQNNLIGVLLPNSKNPTLWLAVKAFREGVLTIKEDKRTGLTTIDVDWKDAAVAAQWANGFVALANERNRARAIDEANRNIKFLNEEIEKTRVVEVQRAMYNLIENETKTLMLANARAEYAFTVVDPAVPSERKLSPHRSLYILFGGFVGAAVGLFVAYLRRARRAGRESPGGAGVSA